MAKLAIKKASTDVTTYVFIQDSSKTTGEGLTGLAYNTASLVASYVRPLGSRAAITLATQTVDGAHSDGGFKEIDATNMPGVYRLDLPDAVCATGVPSVVVMLKGAANMSPVVLEIQLTDFDLNTAAITAAAIADAVWDEAISGHTTGTTFGGKNQKVVPSETVGDYKADVSGLALEATLTAIKGAGWTNETLVKIVTDIAAISAGSGATAQEVWEYATRVLTAGTNLPTVAQIAQEVWHKPTIDGMSNGVDSIGYDLLTAADAIKAKTDNLPADPADDSDIDAQLAAIKSVIDNIHDTDLPAVKAETALIIEDTGTTIPATLGTLATTTHVQEVEDKVDTADAVAYSIKAKTDQLTFTVANKVDATTDTSSIAGDVWSHATRTLTNQGVEATYPAGGDPLTIYRDTTVTISLTGLGDSTGDAGTKIFFTAKENLEDADSDSILQLVCTRANPITDPDTDDLLYVNKVAPTAATEGTFVFADHTDGTAVVSVAASAAAQLPIYAATPLYWDVKMVTAAGVSTILATGEMYIYGTPTRRVAVVE